jgi:hypothetical protein
MMQGTRTAIALAVWTAGLSAGQAQVLMHAPEPPPYYGARGAYEMPMPPPVAIAPPYRPGLPPYEVMAILRESGFLPLGAPARRGGVYVIAAIHPNGEDGRLTLDATSGQLIRFVPAYSFVRGERTYTLDQDYPPAPPPGMHGPRPPGSIPKAASRNLPAAAAVTPRPRPEAAPKTAAAPAQPATAEPVAPAVKPADAPREARAAVDGPARPSEQKKPGFTPLPTQPLPPIQMLD